jgi:PAS domain S-box-containing protein
MKTNFDAFLDYNGVAVSSNQVLDKVEGLAFCVTDHTGRFVEVNNAYTQLYGYSEAELIGNHFTMVLPAEYREYGAKVHDEFIGGAVEMPQEWTVMRKDGSLVRINAEAVRCEKGGEQPSKLTIIEVLD